MMDNSLEENLNKLLMVRFHSFTRRITNTWIRPDKSRGYYEDLRRVFCKDESPEGLYPACVVPQNLLGQVVVITPLPQFETLLKGWKCSNPKYVDATIEVAKKMDRKMKRKRAPK